MRTQPIRPLPHRAPWATLLRRAAVLALAVAVFAGAAALAQDAPVPERFATFQTDVDLPGGDLQSIFDVTLERCSAACLRDGACAAFTFNARNGSCFLKDVPGEPVAFIGAISATVATRDAEALARARAAAASLTFLDDWDLDEALEQAATLPARYPADGRSEADWLEQARGQSPADAVASTGAAVSVADGGAAWLAHARAFADLAAVERNQAWDWNRQAALAAINAVLRVPDADRPDALMELARALEATFRGESALGAVRLADRLAPGIAPDELTRLREAFGFRYLYVDVDARTATPRICVAFSEELATTRDYAPFVQRAASGLAVEAEGTQLCVTGVAYGERYALTLRAGLPSASGEALVRDVPIDVYVRDRAPAVRFPGQAYVLPARGPRALPVETVNADDLELRLLRVTDRNLVTAIRDGSFLRSLDAWAGARFEDLLTETVWEGTARLAGDLNRTTTSRLPLDEVGDLDPGVYVLRAAVAGVDEWDAEPAMQWFLISDLGVTTLTGSDAVHVVVQRLSDGQPAEGLRVALVARSNRVLGEATTDAQGFASFAGALARGSGNAAPALVLVEGDDDLAVLSLEDAEFDLSDRGVEGRAAPGPIDVFLTTDRGAYRAGETIHATALVRDAQARAIAGLPLTVRLLRPDGVEHARVLASETGAGGFVVALPLAGGVPRGVWRIETYADPEAPALASQTVLVEDFLPERVDVALTMPEGLVAPFAAPPLEVDARYLFGAPAAGLTLTGDVAVEPTDALPGWPGYAFGRVDQFVDTQRFPFPADLRTDAAGRLTARLPLDRLDLDARPYALTVTATLIDGASRPVERTLARTLRPIAPVVGIRPGFDGPLPENAEATFDLVLVDPDGDATAGDLRWQVDRIETRYQWYSVDGRWYWEPVTERQRVAEGALLVADGPARVAVPVEWGQYELRATHEGDPWVSSASTTFAAGWTAVDATRETPDRLEVSLDAERYAPGDTARLRLVPEEPGTALVTVLTDRVVDLRLVAVDGPTTVDLPITAEWGASAYVTASLIRPSDGPEHVPARALGLAHAAVDPGERALQATLVVPAETRSGTRLDATLEVPGLEGAAYATVAAVDLGVLNLTGFEAPDPTGHYFGQRRLGVAIRDVYGRLIDARAGAIGEVRSGGDASAALAKAGPAPAEALVALFSGPVEVTGGRADVSFDLPPFAGTVRLMAVVWTDAAVGEAVADVLVRDPVVVQASLPRFLTPGDESRLRVELTHVTGAAGSMDLSITGHGVGDVPATVALDAGGRAVVDVPLRPTDLGDHTYRIELTTPDGETMARELRLTVQHTDPVTATSSRFELAPGESFTVGNGATAGFRAGTTRTTVAAGAGAALDAPGLILRLTGYPYGCTEQIASSLQPLLFAPDAVARLGLASAADQRAWLQDGVDRMLTRQGRDGSFGLWSAGGWDLWLSAYATDVLLRAEAAGASVPAPALRMALDFLRNELAQAGSMQDGAGGYAYALYVLARAGEAAIGDLRYYADTLPEAFDTPMAAAQLGAALAAYGERERSEAMFEQAVVLAAAGRDEGGWRADYGTDQRDRAALLALAVEAGSSVVDRVALATQVAQGGPVDRLSTQEATWQLRAASALSAAATGLVLDDQPVMGDVIHRYDGAPATLRNDGEAPVAVTLTTFGVAEVAPAAGGTAYSIARTHYTPEGEPADLDDVRVGDRLVVVVEVRPDAGVPGGRLMVDDPLPAGFEIDNANLLRAGDVRALDWLGVHGAAESFEARSDRFLAAVDWTSDAPLVLAYFVRAVSPGDFHYAAPLVEDLYRPGNRAIGETGRLTIRP
jgi:uncharacterized protein YfaS (alpha-2-macroglobulin family)